MITAVSRLFPLDSPARYTLTTRDLAQQCKVDHRAAEDIVLMAEACSGLTVGQHTPQRSLKAIHT